MGDLMIPRSAIVLRLGDIGAGTDLPGLCEGVRLRLRGSGAATVILDVGGLAQPDCRTIDALARIQLTTRRLGRHARLLNASPELIELLALAGLGGVVPCCGTLLFEAEGETEQREEPLRVQEEGDPADPVA